MSKEFCSGDRRRVICWRREWLIHGIWIDFIECKMTFLTIHKTCMKGNFMTPLPLHSVHRNFIWRVTFIWHRVRCKQCKYLTLNCLQKFLLEWKCSIQIRRDRYLINIEISIVKHIGTFYWYFLESSLTINIAWEIKWAPGMCEVWLGWRQELRQVSLRLLLWAEVPGLPGGG